jgi:two-component system, OmpR family, phosphate regulon sensor histidine kinase PhoR
LNTNSSPSKIAVTSALLSSIIPVVLALIFGVKLWQLWLIFFLTFGVSYLIIRVLLERFINRKIKIIYKSIHQSNTQHLKTEQKHSSIERVSNDVSTWAKARKDEIDLLKEQEAYRREFVGNLSHELKTPLFQMQGYVDTLLEGALSDPQVNYAFLNKASKSVDRLIELVDDLSSISRLESGEVKMELTNFDIRKLVEEVFESVGYLAKKKSTTCSFRESANIDFIVEADRKKIQQVLINLVVNGIKYGREGGNVKCGIYDMDQNILIEISDDGEGIPATALPRLFERFYRVEQSRARVAGGSGLGLSIVKHIVEAHGQTIKVRSELKKGSTFGFTLKKVD